jgi:tetratricopeptide (TPR) repeat protein
MNSAATASQAADGFAPQTLKTLQALALRYYAHGLHEPCLTLVDFLLRHQPARAEHHRLRGKALHALERHDQALRAYSRAVQLGLADADIHLYIGQCLILLGRMDLATQALNACLQLGSTPMGLNDDVLRRARALLQRTDQGRRRTDTDPNAQPDAGQSLPGGVDRRISIRNSSEDNA